MPVTVVGNVADHIAGLGRALRRAGVPVDSARVAQGIQAATLVGVERREDLCAALEATWVSSEQDGVVLRELFEAWFADPAQLANALPAAPDAPPPARPQRQRVTDAMAAPGAPHTRERDPNRSDVALSASALRALRHADFASLGADEFRLVLSLARELALPVPSLPARRMQSGTRGARPHWAGVLRQARRTGGEWLTLPRLARRDEPLPLLVLVDVSGSMERYARLLLAFLHAATRPMRRRCQVYAFGTGLTDLTPAFAQPDPDAMLEATAAAIEDYAGGTRLGASLAQLRTHHARRLVGRRTIVLLITDGLDTGEPALLERELAWLGLHARKLLWLNPMLRWEGWQPLARGPAVLQRHIHGMLAVHNLDKLQQLAGGLARLLRTNA